LSFNLACLKTDYVGIAAFIAVSLSFACHWNYAIGPQAL
jgi:hypothetical protein